jgi:chromosome segregation ATPase
MLEKLQKKLASEKESATKDFQAYKTKVAEREQRITLDFQKKYDALNDDVEKMNGKFQERIRAFEASTQDLKKSLDEARSSGSAGIQELRKKYENEIAELVRSSNVKYQDMLVEQLRLQELLKKEHAEALEMAITETGTTMQVRMQQEADVLLGQLRAKVMGEKEAELMALRREFEEKLQQQRDDLMGKLEKALGEMRDLHAEGRMLKEDKARLEKALADAESQLTELGKAMGDKLGGSEARLTQLTADLAEERAKAKQTTTQLQAQLREREEEIERMQRLLKEKNSKIVELEGEGE